MSDTPIPVATKAHEVTPGVVSTMRIAVLYYCMPLGALVILAGVIGWFCGLKDAALIIGAGTGLITFALGAKAWQAQNE